MKDEVQAQGDHDGAKQTTGLDWTNHDLLDRGSERGPKRNAAHDRH